MFDLLHHNCYRAKPLPYISTTPIKLSLGIVQHAYLLGHLCVRIVLGQPKTLEGHRLTIVHTLPNLGHPRGALSAVSLLHDTPELISHRYCMPTSTQPQKLEITIPLQPLLIFRDFLEQTNQDRREKLWVVLPLQPCLCVGRHLES